MCHFNSIEVDGYKNLKEGDEVEVDIVLGDRDPQTEKVIRLDRK